MTHARSILAGVGLALALAFTFGSTAQADDDRGRNYRPSHRPPVAQHWDDRRDRYARYCDHHRRDCRVRPHHRYWASPYPVRPHFHGYPAHPRPPVVWGHPYGTIGMQFHF